MLNDNSSIFEIALVALAVMPIIYFAYLLGASYV